jgi:hypothetical protein
MIADACLEGVKTHQERLRAQEIADQNKEEDGSVKKVSRFEGDIDLQGIDEADIAAQDATEEEVTPVQ